MKVKQSIANTFKYSMVIVAVMTVGILGTLWISTEYLSFKRESDSMRQEYMASMKNLIKNETEKVADYIQFMRSQGNERLKKDIRLRTLEAYEIAMNLYRENEKALSPTELKKVVKDALRPIRFNDGKGYYFATRLDGLEVLFADRPEMEGINLLDMRDTEGKFVIRDMIDIIRNQGEGYYRYTWTKPGEQEMGFPKIAYIKYFEPFDWLVGTGEYLDDIVDDIKREVLDRLETITFGKDGYIFAGQWDGVSLVGPQKGKNMLSLTDSNGRKIVEELIRAARSGGDYVSYVMPKFEGLEEAYPKLSYSISIPEWQWYVGAGVNTDEIESTLSEKRETLKKKITKDILKILLLLMSLLVLVLFVAGFFSNRTKKSFDLFSAFFSRAATESAKIDPENLTFIEFEDLGHSANRMIKERTKAENALMESEERFRSIVEHSHDGIIIVDEAYRFVYVNAEFCGILDREREEVIGRDFRNFLDDESVHLVSDYYRRRQSGETLPGRYEFDILRKSGEKRRVEISSAVIKDASGRPQTVAQILDITERKLAEEALKDSEEKYRQLVESSNDAIFIAQDGVIKFCNPKTEALTGHSAEEMAQIPFSSFIHPDDRKLVKDRHWKRLEGASLESAYAFRIIGPKGEPLWVHLNTALTEWDHRPATINFLRDITPQKRLEEQLQRSQKMEAIGTLAGGIAHDFNNILGAIMGYADIALYDSPKDSMIRPNIEQVLKASHRAKDLVKQILAFSRQGKEDRKPIQVLPVIKEALKLLRASLPSTIEIRQNLVADTATIEADSTQIHQVLMNLCTNAQHAMQEAGGILEVTLTSLSLNHREASAHAGLKPGKHVRLSVRDTGVGMDARTMERIFDPYFTTKVKGVGTGMGLAVVHGIVKNHGGDITVHSEPGKGTTFDLFFPQVELQSMSEEERSEPLRGGSEHILLVDDEETLVELQRQMLERLGYLVSSRTSSIEALEVLRARPQRFDLVITDMTMPNMTGDILAKEIMAIRPDIPIILCTGYSDRITPEKAKFIGIRDLIMKPVVLRDLAEAVRKALDEA